MKFSESLNFTIREIANKTELDNLSRIVAQIEWLLVTLVMLYLLVPDTLITNKNAIIAALVGFNFFIILFHYTGLRHFNSEFKLASEAWVMILFISWVLWHTGKLNSPLQNLYLLPIITSALTLGHTTTLLQTALITACYFYIGSSVAPLQIFTGAYASQLMAQIAPFWLIAYLTTLLANNIQSEREKVKQLSETDSLTGLYNMRAFGKVLATEHERAYRYKRPYTLIVIDSDNLKPVNDKYGHEAGNQLIQHTVNSATTLLRTSDIMARFGGDEFIILLPETPEQQALIVAQRIRERVEEFPLELPGAEIRTSISVGLASYPNDGIDSQEILKKADEAMYYSKTHGRNQVTVYGQIKKAKNEMLEQTTTEKRTF